MKQYEITSRVKAERILALLEKPMTNKALASAMCLSPRGMQAWIDRLRPQIHIVRFMPGSSHAPVYQIGVREDAKRTTMTRAEYWKRYRAKLLLDFDRYDRQQAKDRARHNVNKKKAPASWFAALPGAAA